MSAPPPAILHGVGPNVPSAWKSCKRFLLANADISLSFICDEGINMLVQLDIKDLEAMSLAYDIVRQFENAKGVPSTGMPPP